MKLWQIATSPTITKKINRMKILAFDNDQSGCSYHRIRLPFQYGTQYFDHLPGHGVDEKMKNAELVVWNRDFPLGGYKAAKKAKEKYGFKICVDLDDHWELYPGHYLEDRWKRDGTTRAIKENIMLADVVTVTTGRLANAVRQYHDNVHVIPNALPYGHDQFAKPKGIGPHKNFNFIYAGQKSHLHDVKLVKKALMAVAQDHRDAGFILAGYSAAPDGIWQKMETEFTSKGQLPNYLRVNNRPIEVYMSVYMQADAVIVPLQTNDFNSYKSNLKILEAAVYGLPVICQNTPPYSDCDAPVLFADDTESWRYHMHMLKTDAYYSMAKGMEVSKWCRQHHNLFTWNEKRFEVYKNTINETD